jgi:hypothetical protein
LLGDETLDAIRKFLKEFKVEAKDQEALETVKICLDFIFIFKAIHLFCGFRQRDNPNRVNILKRMIDFLSIFIIDRCNTRTECFLKETLQAHIYLGIDVIAVQAGIAPIYSMSRVYTHANIASDNEFIYFTLHIDNATLLNVNHPYIYFEELKVPHNPHIKFYCKIPLTDRSR